MRLGLRKISRSAAFRGVAMVWDVERDHEISGKFVSDAVAAVMLAEMQRIDDATIEHEQQLRDTGHLLMAAPPVAADGAVSIEAAALFDDNPSRSIAG